MTRKTPEPQNTQESNTRWIQDKMDDLVPDSTPSISSARARLNARIIEKENTMWKKIFNAKYRTAWVTLAAVSVLAVSLSFPQVRVIANSFLGLFRVEHIEAVDVGISLDALPAEMEPYFTALDDIIGDEVIVDEVVKPVEVQDLEEASQLAGFQARIPTYPKGETHLQYQKASTARIVIDRDLWQTLIDSLGYNEFVFPENSDGKEIVFNIPQVIVAGIGDCQYNEINEVKLGSPDSKNCTIFLQGDTPTIEAPPGVDINQAGQIMLQVLGMSAVEAKEFSATVNWATTLVVPVPSDVDYSQVTVEGEKGILLEDQHAGGKAVFTLLWIKNGRLHALIGDGTFTDALRSVNSLQ